MNRLIIPGIAAALLAATSSSAIAQVTGTDQTDTTQGTASAAADPMLPEGILDQSTIEDRLEAREFSDIDIEFGDNLYTGTATWWDEEVDVTVNARTARVIEPSRMTEDQIEAKLEDEGYEDVGDIREAGSEYTVRAERFGEEEEIRVSAATGNVLDPRELSTEQVFAALEEDGYSDVVIFAREGDYGNHHAVAETDDDETVLLEIQPITGDVIEEQGGTSADDA